ncbi:MAG TPA: amidohydrolase family protein [Gemmatimonadaceae bacterium]
MMMTINRIAALAIAAAVASPLSAQTIAITGGKVYPVSSAPIENGTVLMRDGKIVAVGANVSIPADAQRIDATGKWVTPGLINASTQLGLVEVGQVADTRNASAQGHDNVAASFAPWEGLNTQSVLIAPARREGVTNVVIMPGGGGKLVAGQAGFITLVEGMPTDMLLKSPIAMVAQISDNQSAGTNARGELLNRLRELIEDTRAYMRNRAAYERAETREYSASRLDLQAMIPVVEGRLPLLIAADKATDIDAALRVAKENNLKIIIGGGAEAWMVSDKLAAAKVPVLTGAMNNIPGSFATLGSNQENAGLLRRAGVTVVVTGNGPGDEETFNVRNIKQEAGNAVAYGMTWDDALRAVTLTPAEVFGVDDRIGSLRSGRDANVVIWSGDPFEFTSVPEHVYVRGREYLQPDRQQLLTDRYKNLPPSWGTPVHR